MDLDWGWGSKEVKVGGRKGQPRSPEERSGKRRESGRQTVHQGKSTDASEQPSEVRRKPYTEMKRGPDDSICREGKAFFFRSFVVRWFTKCVFSTCSKHSFKALEI